MVNRAPADGTFPPSRTIGWGGTFAGGDVKVARLHPFTLSPEEARRLQGELAPRVVPGPSLDLSRVRYVAGADVSTQGERGYATAAVLSFPGLSLVEVRGFEAPLEFPYVPGLLAFREIPLVVGALEQIKSNVEAIVIDGHGLAHPRGLGLASHIGLFLDVPTVGCAKSRLVGKHEEPGREKGSVTDLIYRQKVVGRVVRTRTGVSPVYVSIGNRIDLDGAVHLVLACCTKYRLPETTRHAHNAANKLRRGEASDVISG